MSRRGNTTVILALSSTAIVGMAALAIDLGYARVVQAHLQNVADAAAHAGSNQFDGTDEGIINARMMAQQIAYQNPVNGIPVYLHYSDITVGYWDTTTRTFMATMDPKYANTLRVTPSIDNLALLFAPLATGATSMPIRARSAMKAQHGGAGAVDCYLPVAVPSCLIPHHTLPGMQNVTLSLNPPAIDNVGWGKPEGNPSDAWVRDQFADCRASGWAEVGDDLGLGNGVNTDAMNELIAEFGTTTTRWDTTKWGAQPPRITGSSLNTTVYGRTVEGAVPVFASDESFCRGTGGMWSGEKVISGFIWGAIYDVKNTGSAASRTIRMRVDVLSEHDAGSLMGGPNYGIVTEDLPAMVE